MKKNIIAAACVSFICSAAYAGGVDVAAEIGTTGYGLHLAVPVHDQVGLRFGVNALTYSYADTSDSVDYDFKLKLQTEDLLLDWYPSVGGTFRFTGGVVHNGNKITAHGRPNSNGTYEINGRTYLASQVGTLNGKIDFRSAAPYLGVGWGHSSASAKTGWGFTADLGVLFQGSPRTSLTNSGCTADPLTCQQIASDVAAEEASLNEDVRSFRAYPVARIGVNYRF